MFKLLLRKQFKELKYSYFKDKKTGKMMKKSKIALLGGLLGICYISLCFAFVGISALLCDALVLVGGEWLVFALFALMTIVLGTFINMFATKAIIYDAKDNELLMTLPIKEKDIVLSRLVVTYFQCMIYTSMVWLPLIIYYLISIKFDVTILLAGIIMFLVLNLLTTVLSCIFGYFVTLLSKLFKGKSYITTIITLTLLGAYYYFYFNVNKYLNMLVEHINEAETFIKTKGFPFYCVGKASIGNITYLLIVILASLILIYLCYLVITKNFTKLIRMHGTSTTKKFDNKVTKQKPLGKALIGRELKHYLSNSTYTINAGLGVVIMVGGAIAAIIFKDELVELSELSNIIFETYNPLPVFIIGVISTIVAMDCLSTPAVSLEGKNYWIIRTLPVSSYDILEAKRQLQFKMNVVPAIIVAFALTMTMGIGDSTQILTIICITIFSSFISFLDLFLGVKGANLKWTSEIVPIKQASNILIAVFGSFIIAGIIIGAYFLVKKFIGVEIYLVILIVIFTLLSKLIDNWIRTKGVKEFESLD